MGLFDGKKGLILGVANDHSLAWAIAQQVLAGGGEAGFTHLPDRPDDERQRSRRRVAMLTDSQPGAKFLLPLDVTKDEDIRKVIDAAAEKFGKLDFLLHSIAHASLDDLKRDTVATSRDGFKMAMEISVYSLLAVVNAARPILNDRATVVTMTYFGGEKAVPGYNVMGICKAALDSRREVPGVRPGSARHPGQCRQRRPGPHVGRQGSRSRRHAADVRAGRPLGPQRHPRGSRQHRRLFALIGIRRHHRRNPARRLRLQHHGVPRPLAGRFEAEGLSRDTSMISRSLPS